MKIASKIRNLVMIIICFTAVNMIFTACKKKTKKDTSNITMINGNISKMVTKNLESLEETQSPIDCYVLSSTTFDTQNNVFGYADCNNIYHFLDAETGVEIKQISLPTTINLVELDMSNYFLIGHYYNGEEGKDHVVTIDINSGNVISDKPFYTNGFWNSSVHFFEDIEMEYVLLHPDNGLVFIDPSTGDITKTLTIEPACVNNVVYDKQNNRLIGTTCLNEMGENHIITIDVKTGNMLSKVLGEGMGSGFAFSVDEMDYDAKTNSYILVSADNEVLFFDVATGKIKEKHEFDFNIRSLKFWRSRK